MRPCIAVLALTLLASVLGRADEIIQ